MLTSSETSVPEILVSGDIAMINEVTELLLESCKSMDLVLISAALDAFYDIFSEEYYN